MEWQDQLSQPIYQVKTEENVAIPMRDEIRLFADIYRPDADGKFPALLSYSAYGKDVHKLPCRVGPSDFWRGTGGNEAGNTDFFVSRGYVHVVAECRGAGFSEGEYCFLGKKEQEDGYDLIEWIASQPWCDGNVGMLGMSYFAMIQYLVAAQRPPHLKAIFAHDAATDLYRYFVYHGGVSNVGYFLHWWQLIPTHTTEPMSKKEFPPEQLEAMIRDLRNNEDIKAYPYLYLITMSPEKNPLVLDLLLHPYDGPFYWERSAKFDKINIPCYVLSRWSAWHMHLPGAFCAYQGITAPKKLMIVKTRTWEGFDRPWHENHEVVLRWYDHWLKGIDTGIMDEPPIRIYVQGIDQWRYEYEWPLARTKWSQLYLREKGMLSDTPPTSEEATDTFTNIPWLRPEEEIPSVKYTTASLAKDTEVTGPMALYFYASLTTQDTNWMVEIKDIDAEGSETTISKGWLKASHRELDESKSKPYQPFHPHTRSLPVKSGEIYEYAVEIRQTSYVIKAGHRIRLEIRGQDHLHLRYAHVPYMKETKHTIYHSPEYISYLLLPIIPKQT